MALHLVIMLSNVEKIRLRDWIVMRQLQIKFTALPVKLQTFSLYIKVGNTFQGNIIFSRLYSEVKRLLQNQMSANETNSSPISHIQHSFY